jgi:hypothetical protein
MRVGSTVTRTCGVIPPPIARSVLAGTLNLFDYEYPHRSFFRKQPQPELLPERRDD